MEGLSLKKRYGALFAELAGASRAPDIIDETNVYQEANPLIRKVMDKIVAENLLPGSRLEGREHFAEFFSKIKSGSRGLILSEHFSNLDLPIICYMLEQDPGDFGPEISRRIVSISGKKLNETSPLVKACADGFTRVVIYPSRSLASVTDPQEQIRGKKINMAAMRALNTAKRNGKVVLVFPSGTRYRPGKPETKRGLREIDSYLRIFDIMILISINGSCLRIDPEDPENMLADRVVEDRLIVASSPVMECKPFRKSIIDSAAAQGAPDPKQATADRIMELLEAQHKGYENC
ncbi:MAG: 1-acyl-sn-glycerol-3-phosphate acyltransferase [Treponema sp.]|jgi:glycerol-3-phosphate O-acyltransferase|nr:1-acyl-sn-glycerol-3-phosphate acyltransferase [Treponema sp.]